MDIQFIFPNWPAPANVHALSTSRNGGHSRGPWNSLNLGLNCGDDVSNVVRNREKLAQHLPAIPQWLQQVHGPRVVSHPGDSLDPLEGDALVARAAGQVCAVLTADCLPVLFCTQSGSCVAVAHAGWRGLAGGILEATIRAMGEKPDNIIAWLGPAIGSSAYEVGDDVRNAFADLPADCFSQHGGRWLFDLCRAARHKLMQAGVRSISGGDFCTFSDQDQFFSYRRDGVCGRMASLIWLNPTDQ